MLEYLVLSREHFRTLIQVIPTGLGYRCYNRSLHSYNDGSVRLQDRTILITPIDKFDTRKILLPFKPLALCRVNACLHSWIYLLVPGGDVYKVNLYQGSPHEYSGTYHQEAFFCDF